MDNGKPFNDAFNIDLMLAIKCYRLAKKAKLNSFIRFAILLLCQTRYFAGWADKNYGQTIPIDGPYFSMTRQDIDTTDLFALISLSHSHKNN